MIRPLRLASLLCAAWLLVGCGPGMIDDIGGDESDNKSLLGAKKNAGDQTQGVNLGGDPTADKTPEPKDLQDPPPQDPPKNPPPQDPPKDPPKKDPPAVWPSWPPKAPTPPPPTPPAGTPCTSPVEHFLYLVKKSFIKEGYPHLAAGLTMDHVRKVDTSAGYHWGPAGQGKPYSTENLCATLVADTSAMNNCTSNDGRCHCSKAGNNESCRCERMIRDPQREICRQLMQKCPTSTQLVTRVNIAQAAFAKYLYNPYNLALKNVPTAPSAHKPFRCLASPLVLDLAGDGVAPTSAKAGTHFDLTGFGATRTAWVEGDDALLAMDKNGNGSIDSGRELFGTATELKGGGLAEDGFAALAPLDSAALGGNQNGIIDAEDLAFSALMLWRDKNKDGFADDSETQTLSQAGVIAIELQKTCSSQRFDRHGNDLGLRGRFHLADGQSREVVDVFFVSE